MHCTSTTIASTAPVRTASSCWRKLPAIGMPCRIRISFAVQQMPPRLIPWRPSPSPARAAPGPRGDHDHLREGRLVAVDDDVDLVLLEDAEVEPGADRLGHAEEHVAEVGGDHRAAPAVGQGRLRSLCGGCSL